MEDVDQDAHGASDADATLASALGSLKIEHDAYNAERYAASVLAARAVGTPLAALHTVPTDGRTRGDATVLERLSALMNVRADELYALLATHPCLVIAGGAVLHCIAETARGKSERGDVDVWIVGASDEAAAAVAALHVLHSGAVAFAPAILTIVRHGARDVQIVRTAAPDMEALLAGFDGPPCQVGVNAAHVLATPEFLATMRSGVIQRWHNAHLAADRVRKYAGRGFSLGPGLQARIQGAATLHASSGADEDMESGDAPPRSALEVHARSVLPWAYDIHDASVVGCAPPREEIEKWSGRADGVLELAHFGDDGGSYEDAWLPYHGRHVMRSWEAAGARVTVAWGAHVDTRAPAHARAPFQTQPDDVQSRIILPISADTRADIARARRALTLRPLLPEIDAVKPWMAQSRHPLFELIKARHFDCDNADLHVIVYPQRGARVFIVSGGGARVRVTSAENWSPFPRVARTERGELAYDATAAPPRDHDGVHLERLPLGPRVRAWGVPLVYEAAPISVTRLYAHTIAVYEDD